MELLQPDKGEIKIKQKDKYLQKSFVNSWGL